jgi:hypothetical protein
MLRRRMATSLLVLLSCLALGTAQVSAHTGIISTHDYLNALDRQETLQRVDALLARDEVRKELERLGVAPDDALARVEALADQELQMLAAHLEELPAGAGLLGLVGAVFIVLLILELTGVINIFNRI